MNEDLEITEIDGVFYQPRSLRKRSMKKKIGLTERPQELNLGKAIVMAICYHCASMHDLVCEFACAVRKRRNN